MPSQLAPAAPHLDVSVALLQCTVDCSPLHMAAMTGQTAVVVALLEAGADVDCRAKVLTFLNARCTATCMSAATS